MKDTAIYARPQTLSAAEIMIKDNMVKAIDGYVAVGYALRVIRDDKLYRDGGHTSFEDYIHAVYGKDKTWASKCIRVNMELSIDGSSDKLAPRYKGYSVSKLIEISYLDPDDRDQILPDMTVETIRQIRKQAPRQVARSQPPPPAGQPVQAAGSPVPEPERQPSGPKVPRCIYHQMEPCQMEACKAELGGEVMPCHTECCRFCERRGVCDHECSYSRDRVAMEGPPGLADLEPTDDPQPVIDVEYQEVEPLTGIALRPCPFCGGRPEAKQFANPRNYYCVECTVCHCRTDGHIISSREGTKKENIAANAAVWNRRVN